VTLQGVKYTASQLVKMFQDGIDVADATDSAKETWSKAVAAERSNRAALKGVQQSLRNHVAALYGETTTQFTDFGFTPKKVRTVSADTKAAAAKKRKATREARHTMGPRQKLEVTGEQSPATPAPVEAPVASQPVQPAPAAAQVNGITRPAPPS
jgi:hypothetical protein